MGRKRRRGKVREESSMSSGEKMEEVKCFHCRMIVTQKKKKKKKEKKREQSRTFFLPSSGGSQRFLDSGPTL